jgi:hypothetical protein
MRLGHEKWSHHFSCLGGSGTDSTKSASGHITQNMFFCIWWDLRVTYCILAHPCHETLLRYFSYLGWTGTDLTKSTLGHVTLNLCFASSWIYRPHNAFRCVWGVKCWCTIFHAGVGPLRFPSEGCGTHYAELVFLHPVGFVGHVVHFGASGVWNVDALFFMLGWALCDFHKNSAGTCYPEPVLLHPIEYVGHVVHSEAFGAWNVNELFFMLGWDRCGFIKSEPGHVTVDVLYAAPQADKIVNVALHRVTL